MVFTHRSPHKTKLTNHCPNSLLVFDFVHFKSQPSICLVRSDVYHAVAHQLARSNSTVDLPHQIRRLSRHIAWISVRSLSTRGHAKWVVSPCYVSAGEANRVKFEKSAYSFGGTRNITYRPQNPLPDFCTFL